MQQLSVYINDATALILLKYKMRGQSATETTHQALAAYDYFKEAEADRLELLLVIV